MVKVLSHAVEQARDGFPVSEVIGFDWAGSAAALKQQPGFAATYLVDDRAPRKGEVFRNPALAETLSRISSGARDAFYRGELPRAIQKFVGAYGDS